jgi:hypothetical protein
VPCKRTVRRFQYTGPLSPYYLTDGNLVAAQEVPLNPGVGVINNAISAFNSDPGSQSLRSPLPDGAGITAIR